MMTMTYRELKEIKGRLYIYERTSYRIDGMVKHRSKYIKPLRRVTKRRKKGGRKPTIFVRELTPEERNQLEKKKRSRETFGRDRALTILYSAQKMSVKKISQKVNRDRRTVIAAIRAFNQIGIKSLTRKKANGAVPKFTKEQRAKILEIANTHPSVLNLPFTTWSLPKLKNYLIKECVVSYISHESIRKMLRKEGFKIKKSKRFQYSNDPQYAKKNF